MQWRCAMIRTQTMGISPGRFKLSIHPSGKRRSTGRFLFSRNNMHVRTVVYIYAYIYTLRIRLSWPIACRMLYCYTGCLQLITLHKQTYTCICIHIYMYRHICIRVFYRFCCYKMLYIVPSRWFRFTWRWLYTCDQFWWQVNKEYNCHHK